MLVDLIVNWRMKLFVSLMFLAALQSCSMEQTNLYAAWWLEQLNQQGTSRQIVKREVKLPDWYVRLYSILSSLRSLAKMGKGGIFSMLSLALLIGGAFCLWLGILLCSRQMGRESTSNQYWFVSLKGNSKIIGIGVAIATLPVVTAKPVHETVTEISLDIPERLCLPCENSHVALLVESDHAIREDQEILRQASAQQTNPGVEKRNVRVGQSKKTIGCSTATEKQMTKFYRSLSEKDKRRYAGVEALKLGRGGIVYIAALFECDRKTVSRGIEELRRMSRRHVDQNRIRRKGGGRKPYSIRHKDIDRQFHEVLKDNTAGDPMREEVVWTNLTPQEICRLLAQNHNRYVSPTVVSQLLEKHNYRQRKLFKNQTMRDVPYRNAQFENIAMWRSLYYKGPNPMISMDSKKKEYIGNFYRAGRLYTRETLRCYDHDFSSFADGIIIPHSLYDVKKNKGYIHLGTSHDTSEFACDCIKNWWMKYGRYDYPDADSILILCDGGGSNACRHYIFKQDLQSLVNEIGIEIRIAHYPPYCSKWNPIEHRLFPHVTRACQGVLFENIELVKELMQKTRTRKGLEAKVEVVDRHYELGRKASDEFKQNMSILFDETLPTWNYRAIPNGEVI